MSLAKDKSLGILRHVIDLSLILAVFLYFVGWIYIFNYLNYFGLSIREVDIQIYYIIIFSINFLLFLVSSWIITVPLVVFSVLIVYIIVQIKAISKAIILLSVLGIFIISLIITKKIALQDAVIQSNPKISSLKVVEILFKNEFVKNDTTSFKSIDGYYSKYAINEKKAVLTNIFQLKMRLLTESNDFYFILFRAPNSDFPVVYAIRKDDVQLLITH